MYFSLDLVRDIVPPIIINVELENWFKSDIIVFIHKVIHEIKVHIDHSINTIDPVYRKKF